MMSLPQHLRLIALRNPPLLSSLHAYSLAGSTSALSSPSASFPLTRKSANTLLRHAFASTAASKAGTRSTNRRSPSTLAKPDRFRPPSHPSGRAAALAAAARRRNRNPFADGPPLSEAERTAQRVKRYPNTFPRKGTVARKVLSNRSWHMWFALVFLTSLSSFLIISDFLVTTSPEIYELIPPLSTLFTHPLNFVSTYWHLFGLHLHYTSAVAQEQRQRKNDDVQKRREFRLAHGLEEDLPTPALPGTVVAGGVGKAANEEIMALVEAKNLRKEGKPIDEETLERMGGGSKDEKGGSAKAYKDFDGNTQLAEKKWYDFWS